MPSIHPHVLKLAQDLGCNVFVESGTYLGASYCRAVESGYFERVYSVEIAEQLYQNARKLYDERGPYRVFRGKSHEVFANSIFPLCGPDDSILFWLDGHYSMGNTEGAQDPCPLLDELAAIRDACPTRSIVVAIDDTDDFGLYDVSTPGLQWPTRHEVERLALQINPGFITIDYTGNDGQLEKICRGVLIFSYRRPSNAWKKASPHEYAIDTEIRPSHRGGSFLHQSLRSLRSWLRMRSRARSLMCYLLKRWMGT